MQTPRHTSGTPDSPKLEPSRLCVVHGIRYESWQCPICAHLEEVRRELKRLTREEF